jgi:peroxiredoxin Q/BCP
MRLRDVLRTIAATVAAAAEGAMSVAKGGAERGDVELKPGDRAPDFALPGSDGRIYRLADLLGGGPIVIAWFPKAFTGG